MTTTVRRAARACHREGHWICADVSLLPAHSWHLPGMNQPPDDDSASAARARARHAGNLLNTGRFDQALVEYDWLWRHLHREAPAMAGVRVSFMAGEMGHLCRQFQPAQAHFEQLRDQTEAIARADTDDSSFETRLDWMVLNEVVGEADRTLAWFEGVDVHALADSVVSCCIPRLVPLLRRRGRWAEIGQLFRDPLAEVRLNHDMVVQSETQLTHMPAAVRQRTDELMKDLFREQSAVLYRGLCAAGRTEEAAAVQREAIRLDPSADMREALVPQPTAHVPGPSSWPPPAPTPND